MRPLGRGDVGGTGNPRPLPVAQLSHSLAKPQALPNWSERSTGMELAQADAGRALGLDQHCPGGGTGPVPLSHGMYTYTYTCTWTYT